MTDSRSIEGSEARARDRGDDALFASPPGESYLGDPEVVEQLVRRLATQTLEHRVAVLDGSKTQEQALAGMEADREAVRLILQGQDPAYSAMDGWNVTTAEPGSINASLSTRGYDPDPSGALTTLLTQLQIRIQNASAVAESGQANDGQVEFLVDIAVEETAGELLGMPVSAD